MANNYKPGKWTGELACDIKGDATAKVPSFELKDINEAISKLKKAQTSILATLDEIAKQTKALKNHNETGKWPERDCEHVLTRVKKLRNNLNLAINEFMKMYDDVYNTSMAAIMEIEKINQSSQYMKNFEDLWNK